MAKKIDPLNAPPALSSMGDLLRARGVDVARDAGLTDSLPLAASSPLELDLSGTRKVVVRRERKGHGGKTVTVVEGLGLPAARLEHAARAMRKALGCGSWVDGEHVVLQGDRAAGADTWLRAHGARQVTRGN
ncbi:MAG: translation initiation factor [bacterium]